MPTPRPRRRRLLVAFFVGVVVTVATSWTAMFTPSGPDGYGPPADESLGLARAPDDHKIWHVRRGRNAWHMVVQYWHLQMSGLSVHMAEADFQSRRIDIDTLPARFRPESLSDLHMMAWYRETGFPFAALTCSVHWKEQVRNSDIIYTVQDGVQLPRDADFNPRALPLRPVWAGFAANVVVWGGLWLAFGLAWRAVRRWRGARRGTCLKCGYSRRGLAPSARCPECGAPPRA